MSKEFFNAEKLLDGYAYPSSYVEFVNEADQKNIEPWWLIGSSQGLFEISYNLLNSDLACGINAIPFAKSEETKALAFFDEAGRVYFYIGENTLADIDWGTRFHLSGFDEWLEKVKSGEV